MRTRPNRLLAVTAALAFGATGCGSSSSELFQPDGSGVDCKPSKTIDVQRVSIGHAAILPFNVYTTVLNIKKSQDEISVLPLKLRAKKVGHKVTLDVVASLYEPGLSSSSSSRSTEAEYDQSPPVYRDSRSNARIAFTRKDPKLQAQLSKSSFEPVEATFELQKAGEYLTFQILPTIPIYDSSTSAPNITITQGQNNVSTVSVAEAQNCNITR